jgi:hypothetical protein
MLIPASDVSANTAASALWKHTGRFGAPHQIMTDKGSQFMNDTLKRFAHIAGIAHLTSIPYSKEENGIVERQNKEVNRHIRNILFDLDIVDSWTDFIVMIEKLLNSSVKQPLGVSPNTILFANSIDVDVGLLTELNQGSETTQPRSIRDYVDTLMSNQQKIIAAAIASQTKLNEQNLTKRYASYKTKPNPENRPIRRSPLIVNVISTTDTTPAIIPVKVYMWTWDGIETPSHIGRTYIKSPLPDTDTAIQVEEIDMAPFILTTYHVGDYVLRKHAPTKAGNGPPEKYAAWWRGPYIVTRIFHDSHKAIYTIRDLVTDKEYEADVCQLKPFFYDPHYVYPLNIALKGSGEFLVDHIVTHDFTNPKNPVWRVRWAGYDESDDTWEPLTILKDVEQFHTYCLRQRQFRYLPLDLRKRRGDRRHSAVEPQLKPN